MEFVTGLLEDGRRAMRASAPRVASDPLPFRRPPCALAQPLRSWATCSVTNRPSAESLSMVSGSEAA
ncbi:hypothetical protein ACVW2K_002316 [Nocardioides sp. HB32]